MKNPIFLLWNDERGLILSAELVLILTIAVLGMVVGLNSVSTSVNNELNDLAGAFGSLDQSFYYRGLTKWGHASVAGSGYADRRDFCDCTILTVTAEGIHQDAGHGYSTGPVVASPAAVDSGPALPLPCPTGTCPDVVAPCATGDCPAVEPPCDTCHAPPRPAPELRTPELRIPAPRHHQDKPVRKPGSSQHQKHSSRKKK